MTIVQGAAQDHLLRFQRVASDARGPRPGLGPLSFTLDPGARAWLVGPAGAGKSLALDLIARVAPPPQGRIILFGSDLSEMPRARKLACRRRLGVVYQDLRLVEDLGVLDNLALAARAVGRTRDDYGPKAIELLAWMGLGRVMGAKAASLDGEGRCRLALARALINSPDLLLIDDPIRALPPERRPLVLKLIGEAHRAGIAVLMATRDDGEAVSLEGPIIRLTPLVSPVPSIAATP